MTKKLKKDFLASFYFFSLQEDEEEERIFLKKKHFLSNWQAATDSPFTFHNLTAKITSRLIMWVLTSLETDDAVDLLQISQRQFDVLKRRRLRRRQSHVLVLYRRRGRHCCRCCRRGVTAVVVVVVASLPSWRHCRRCRRRRGVGESVRAGVDADCSFSTTGA